MVVAHFLNILFCFSVSVLFAFQSWGFLLRYPRAQRFFPQPRQPTEKPRHSSFLFLISSIYFRCFLKMSISPPTLPICSCTFLLDLLEPQHVHHVCFTFLSDGFNRAVIFGSDACPVSANHGFCLVFCLWFAL